MFRYASNPSVSTTLETFQKADIYSFGITIWEILHRKIPWETAEVKSEKKQKKLKKKTK